MNRISVSVLAACGVLANFPAAAADADLQALREEIAQMRKSYEQRIDALEQRLTQAETGRAQTSAAAPATRAASFNPEIGLNLQGALTSTRIDPASWTLQGFVPPGAPEEVGPPRRRGFTAQETELTLAANVDPNFRGYLNLALTPDNTVELEEAYFQTLGLGAGFTLKGGRFLSGIGYHNERHPHVWDFADAPLAYTVFFGNKLSAEGLQLKWLAPTVTWLELGLEAGRDDGFPGGARNKGGSALGAAFMRTGGDVGIAHNWRAGLSYVATDPGARAYDGVDAAGLATRVSFAGRSRTAGADFVWKWAPNGNPAERNFKLQAEYFRRNETGSLSCAERDASGACGGAAGLADSYRSSQSGYYLQGVWQFMPRWRLGYRHDRLDSGTTSLGPALVATDLPQLAVWKPQRNTVMLDYASSEFARLRLQFARDSSRGPGRVDQQLWLQYVMSIGAHGAHKF
ncbi:MAG: TonB-dependent receptor [Betaproteobacteria bacterium]|nr:TonB-dependent receptor [Betaproteobacteria bacterium]